MPLVLVLLDYILFSSTAPKPQHAISIFKPNPENRCGRSLLAGCVEPGSARRTENRRRSACRRRKEKMPGRAASAARPAVRRQRYDATKFAGTIPSSTYRPTPFPRGARRPTPFPRGVTCGQHGGIAAGFCFDSGIRSARSRKARGTRRGLILALTAITSVTATG